MKGFNSVGSRPDSASSEDSPAEAVDEKADGEGTQHSSDREDGHGHRPQSCQGALRDGLRKPAAPRFIVEALYGLKREKR